MTITLQTFGGVNFRLLKIFAFNRACSLSKPVMSTSQLFDANMAKRHPIRILLVDDNAINLKVASRMLERMGYKVDKATNGIEALQAQQRSGYDLIFMDIQMPEMDGVTATKLIIKKYAQDRPRIVAVTAHAMKGDKERYLQAGMDGYISKPVRVGRLVEEIEETPCNVTSDDEEKTVIGKMITLDQSTKRLNPSSLPMPVNFELFADMLGMTMEDVEEMLPELVELFITDSVSQIDMMEEAIKTQNYLQLKNAAHKMKGGAASIAATHISKTCDLLEKMGLNQNLDRAKVTFEQAKLEFYRLETWLADFQLELSSR